MTIRTQDFQIANIGAPVFQTARPRPRSIFRADLSFRCAFPETFAEPVKGGAVVVEVQT